MIDLRSDTVTRPTQGMRAAMASAEVGDDVYGEDPTVRALESEIAEVCGKPCALFVSSGTMGNQLAIACHTRPGDEVIVGEGAHPMFYESGAAAALSGVQFAVAGRGGFYTAEELEAVVKPAAYYSPRSRLVSIENTHNRAGGKIFPKENWPAIRDVARRHNLALHLDGARLWNAAMAAGADIAKLCEGFDTVSICFSKGLGAPVGSALLGSQEVIQHAHRLRKMWGGGMRQVGILAAGALYALRNHRSRLGEDHQHATALAKSLDSAFDVTRPETNIVLFRKPNSAQKVVERAKSHGVMLNATSPHEVRAVTHLDVSAKDIETAARVILELSKESAT